MHIPLTRSRSARALAFAAIAAFAIPLGAGTGVAAAAPTITPGQDPGFVTGSALRIKGANGPDVYLGVNIGDGPPNRVQADAGNPLPSGTYPIRFAFDPAENAVTLTGPGAVNLTYDFDVLLQPGCATSGWNALVISPRDSRTDGGIGLQNVVLNGTDALGGFPRPAGAIDVAGAPGQENTTISGIDLSGGFVLEGDLQVQNLNANEALRLEIRAGCIPDTTPPTITASATAGGDPYPSGTWTNQDVTVSYKCTDDESGVASVSPDDVVTGEGDGQSRTGTCIDNAGNDATATFSGIRIDKTDPTVTISGARTYSILETVNVTCTPADALSGVAASTCSAPAPAPGWTFGAGSQTVTGTAADNAGNATSTSAAFTVAVNGADLCTLTRQFVQGSALYRKLGFFSRVAVDLKVATACKTLAEIGPHLLPWKKALFVDAYQGYVVGLQIGGFLTGSQTATLKSLAESL